MRLPVKVRRKKTFVKRANRWWWFIGILIISIIVFLYILNNRLTPTYLQYAEVQTNKIASLVISKAINSRIANVLDVNDIIEHVPSEQSNMVTTKFNTEIINRVLADTTSLVQTHLEQAEEGNMEYLPYIEDVDYDETTMKENGGIVFFVPLGQAAHLPLIGNLGPRIPIRFHVIGNVQSNVLPSIKEFGINNAYVEVSIVIRVKVQIIVPFATKTAIVEQKIPVAMGLIQGQVPQIFNSGDGLQPSIETPLQPK